MGTATRKQEGDSLNYTPGSAVAEGDVIVQEQLVGVAVNPIAADVLGAIAVKGVFAFPKATGGGSGIAAGKVVYWDVGDQEAKEDSETGANPLLGKTTLVAADADTEVEVRLDQ